MELLSTVGALSGLGFAIILVLLRFSPVYSLLLGALVGGIIGGASLGTTVSLMIEGAQGIASPVLRILAAGILTGALIQTNAAKSIALGISSVFQEKFVLFALCVSAMILTAIGVFIDITVITLTPIALSIGYRTGIKRSALLIAMIGGGKAGNIISPNPNTIAAANAFDIDVFTLQISNIGPALIGLAVSFIIAQCLRNTGTSIAHGELQVQNEDDTLPHFGVAVLGPLVSILLLALRPLANINIDPLIALPVGGFVCIVMTGHLKQISAICTNGLSRMSGVALILISTGAIAGIIKNSAITSDFTRFLDGLGLSPTILAPLSSMLMSAATASTTAGTVVASETFSSIILQSGITPLAAACVLHAGATVFDHLPHGSFFHATAGASNMNIPQRLALIPYECIVGFSLVLSSYIMHIIL